MEVPLFILCALQQNGFRHTIVIVHYSFCVNKIKSNYNKVHGPTTPLLFTTLKMHEALETTHSRSMASFTMLFYSFVRIHTKYLATKLNHCARSLN